MMFHCRLPQASGLLAFLVVLLLAATQPLQAQFVLSSTFAGGSTTPGNMFEVKALSAVTIDSFDVHITGIPNAPFSYEIWALNTPGSYVGYTSSSANWTLIGSKSIGGPNATGVPTPLLFNLSFPIPTGQIQSFYIACTNGVVNTTIIPIGTLIASDTNLEIYSGRAGNYFSQTMSNRAWNGSIHYSPYSTISDDLELSRFTSPLNNELDCNPASTAAQVTVEMRNRGTNPIPVGTVIPVSYSVDGGPAVNESFVLSAPLLSGHTLTYSFVTTADLSALGSHTLTATANYLLDLNNSNDSSSTTIGSGGSLRVVNYPYVQEFDFHGNTPNVPSTSSATPPVGFIQETADGSGPGSNWRFRNDPTPTGAAGPSADHTVGISGQGGFAYVDDDGEQATVNLRSPCFDLNGVASPRLRFFVYSNNIGTAGTDSLLSLDVINQGSGLVTTNVYGPTGSLGPSWQLVDVDLTAFSGQLIQCVLRVNTQNGANTHDIAIDDLSLFDNVPLLGQAPQFGSAVLDINSSRNPHGSAVSSGLNGPYFSTINTGDTLVFSMSGESSQPIILFAGALNPGVVSFAGIGSIDCGGPVDPLTGLPTSLLLLADGSQSQQGGLNAFFITSQAGEAVAGFSVPALPSGVLSTFQCAFLTTSGSGVALSNAVEVTIQ